jgi:hypothetical protein
MVDTIGEDDGPNEVYGTGVKRTMEDQIPGGTVVQFAPPVIGNSAPPAKRVARNKGKAAMKQVPVEIDPSPPEVLVPKKKRRTPRRLQVETKTLKVWDRLAKLDSGLSMLDWVAIDKNAERDLVDGLRDLRVQRPKRYKRHLNADHQVMEINLVEDESDYDSDTTTDYDSDHTSSSSVKSLESEFATVDEDDDLNFSEAESVYRYPYDLNKMRASSPLKGMIKIGNKAVECIFDTGGSISVLSKYLCESLGLVPIDDSLQLVGFDNKKPSTRSKIVLDVPINVAGKIRPEHMCIQDTDDGNELCILGIPWFKSYGVEINLGSSTIKIPSTTGVVSLPCYTTSLPGQVSKVDNKAARLTRLDANLKELKQVYHIKVSQKYTETLEESIVPIGYEEGDPVKELIYDINNISSGVHDLLAPVVEEYAHCFSEVSGLTKIKGYSLAINLKENAVPVRTKPFRLSWSDEEELNKYVDEMLALDLIEESDGTWTSPAFMVPKRDGSGRCVIDYRKANENPLNSIIVYIFLILY